METTDRRPVTKYTEFLDRVQSEGNTESSEQAEQSIHAVLETLGERISATEQENLAAQLPGKLKQPVLEKKNEQLFDLEEFFHKVSARADIGFPEAVKQSQVVASVLSDAISQGELNDVLSEVDEEYHELFDMKSSGPESPQSIIE